MNRFLASLLCLLVLTATCTRSVFAASCAGEGGICNACTNCNSCGHCAGGMGKCSVCMGSGGGWGTGDSDSDSDDSSDPDLDSDSSSSYSSSSSPSYRSWESRVYTAEDIARAAKAQREFQAQTTAQRRAQQHALKVATAQWRAHQPWSGRVVEVTSGDFLKVQTGKRKIPVRLYGMDAPEHQQPWGSEALKQLKKTALGKTVTVHPVENGKTIVGWVYLKKLSLNWQMLQLGLAWHDKVNAGFEKPLLAAEQYARGQRLRLWSRNAVAPWSWREGVRKASWVVPDAGPKTLVLTPDDFPTAMKKRFAAFYNDKQGRTVVLLGGALVVGLLLVGGIFRIIDKSYDQGTNP